MSKKRNYKQAKRTSVNNNIDNIDKNLENNVDDDFDMDLDIDDDMAERLSYYETLDIDEDSEGEEEIKEFISRNYDVVAESRKRVNQPGRRKVEDKTKKDRFRKERMASPNKDNIFKVILDKWLEIYNKNTSKILYGTLGGLALILLVVICITLVKYEPEKTDDKREVTTTTGAKEEVSTVEEATEQSTGIEDTIVPESEDSDIHKLIINYIDAAYIKADIKEVEKYVDDVTNINVEEYRSHQKYIEAYSNVQCYKFDYSESNTFIVAVTYDAKIYNIETAAPSGTVFVVKYNGVDKVYKIHNITEGEQLDVYIAARAQEINYINSQVKARLDEAKGKDADLKKILDIMENVGKKSEETVAPTE